MLLRTQTDKGNFYFALVVSSLDVTGINGLSFTPPSISALFYVYLKLSCTDHRKVEKDVSVTEN